MRRLLVVLGAFGVLWFGWRSWGNADVAAGSPDPLEGVPAAGAGDLVVPLQTGVPSGQESHDRSSRSGPTDLEAFVASVRRGDPSALASAYRRLLDLRGAEHDRLAVALSEAEGASAASMLAALGNGNAFLHVAKGRDAGRRLLDYARSQKPEDAVGTYSSIMELAMRGAIEKEDVEARAFVDDAYAAAQGALNRTVFNPEFVAAARTHKVAGGETLDRIAAAYRKQGLVVDGLTLAVFNRIDDPSKLRAGQLLKVPVEPVRTVIEKRSYLMALYLGDLIFRLYWVGHGKDDRTPETTFRIGLKQERPDWYFDGRVIPYGHPDNILGHYFVKFEHESFSGYGAHGTPLPESVGTMASRGCIRMRDADIRDYFRIVPRGSEVVVKASQGPGSR